MIRKAENKDLSKIVELSREGHTESVITTAPLDVKTLRTNLQICILSAEHLVLVVDIEDEISCLLLS